ncbi:MAG: hypothetical protein WKG07_20455 [Hymenobacter sp.]
MDAQHAAKWSLRDAIIKHATAARPPSPRPTAAPSTLARPKRPPAAIHCASTTRGQGIETLQLPQGQQSTPPPWTSWTPTITGRPPSTTTPTFDNVAGDAHLARRPPTTTGRPCTGAAATTTRGGQNQELRPLRRRARRRGLRECLLERRGA